MNARIIPISRISARGKSRPSYLLEVALECGAIADLGSIERQRTFLITGPELVQHIFDHNADNYSKRTAPSTRSSRLLLGEGLLASEGDTNRGRRRLMSGVFRRESLLALYDIMASVARGLVAAWQSSGRASFEVDVAESMRDLSQQMVIRTMFGEEYVESTRKACAALRTISDYVGRSFLSTRPIPLVVPTPANLRYGRAVRELDAAVFHMIESCEKGQTSGTLLSTLVSALQRGEMTASGVRDEVINMFLAGQESVSAALAWTCYLVSRAPTVLSTIDAELREVTAGSVPSFDQLNGLVYMQQVIQEALRLYPPGWLIDRVSRQADEVAGYHIPAGSMILVSQFVSHRLPSFWGDPEGFDPNRFSDNGHRINPYVYFPWGIGRHLCYGKAFAMMELKLVLACLLQNFRLMLRPGLEPMEAVPGIAFRPRGGLPMLVTPRRGD